MPRPGFVQKAIDLAASHVILDEPVGWVWYLEERVVCQSPNSRDFLVPHDLPDNMFSLKSLEDSELSRCKQW